MSKAWSGGSTRAWRALRNEVLERDNHQCRLRYQRCTGIATEVHHLDGKVNGDNPHRCVAACHNCHAIETRAAIRPQPQAARTPERHPGLR
jgi:5-methylcytosine-specific restriction endonuclease McrA